jgi:hypothetical protein
MDIKTLDDISENVRDQPAFSGIREGVTAMGQGVLPKSNLRKKKGKKSKAKRKTKKDCGCK